MTDIKQGTVWKFKPGRGDRYRRLRVKHVQQADPHNKVGPYVEVRSFYLDESAWPSYHDKSRDTRRRPKDILVLQATLSKDYECVTTIDKELAVGESPVQMFGTGLYG